VYNLLRLLKLSRDKFSFILINAFRCLLVIGLDLTKSFFCIKRHLGKFCFQIHEFGSDIIKK